MIHPSFEALLSEARTAHQSVPALAEFCAFPDDLVPQRANPFHIKAAQLMAAETGLFGDSLASFRDAFIAAGPHATWRETYKGTDIGSDFMDRFGCYCLVGEGGPWKSAQMASYVVYMPAGLNYTWHHHPAEELYLVVAGEAVFRRQGEPEKVLGAGESSFHRSNQPHAMETMAHPVMAYVVWRNHFGTRPVLTKTG